MHSAPGSVALPVAGYIYNSDWTPLLAGSHPLEWQLASLHQNRRVVVALPLSVTGGSRWRAPHAAAMAVLGGLGGRPSIQEAEVVHTR
jgi:hypothetical protein